MSVFKRVTSRGCTTEFHYKFKQDGKYFYGVCEGCTTERAALVYEKNIRDTAKQAAEQKSIKAIVDNFREILSGGEAVSIDDAFALYLDKPKKRIPSEHQIKRNRTYWEDFRAFMAANYPDIIKLSDVTDKHAGSYINLLRTSGAFIKEVSFTRQGRRRVVNAVYTPHNEQLSPRTINARHKAVKAVFSWLAADAGLSKNPFDIPTLDNDTVSRDAFTDSELLKIGDAMTMPYMQPIFTIGLCTGLTLGDICLLRWDEIADGWINNKRRRKTGVMLDIPIMPPLAAFLDQQRPITGAGEFVAPELAAMYQTNPSGVMNRVKSFLEGLGIETATRVEGRSRAVSTKAAHAMRHTFAYLAGVYNVPQPVVQSVLGHMSPEMTALYQKHASREAKAKFLRQLPDVLRGSALSSANTESPDGELEPEREALRRLSDTLTIQQIKKILDSLMEGAEYEPAR